MAKIILHGLFRIFWANCPNSSSQDGKTQQNLLFAYRDIEGRLHAEPTVFSAFQNDKTNLNWNLKLLGIKQRGAIRDCA
jgi:hypothetical protein